MGAQSKEKAIGIDLGTTYSCVGVWQHDRVEIIVNEQGNRSTPSIVAFTSNETLVGDAARFQIASNHLNTVCDAKRIIGRKFNDASDRELWPFTIESSNEGKPMIQVAYKGQKKLFSAEEISSMVLAKMKMVAEQFLMCNVKKAVITVPAYFNDGQRRATIEAAKMAGLDVMRIINEPTAAALTYGFPAANRNHSQKQDVVIFDLGGGTLDVSLLTFEGAKIVVKAVAGDMHLGGQDFTNRLLNYCAHVFNQKHNVNVKANARAVCRLDSECERAKRNLSCAMETAIEIDGLFQGKDFYITISRAKFEELNSDLFERCIQILKQCLKDAETPIHQIKEVVLVGGSSRIPKIEDLISELFKRKKLCKSMNPDEAVAYGAALQAAALNHEDIHLVVRDITPLSLGVGVKGGIMEVVVPRNTPIPTRITKSFTTGYDYIKVMSILVYEGERALTAPNNFLGKFQVDGIQEARARVPSLQVCFQVDADGILTVSAQDKRTGASNRIIICYNEQRQRPSKEEVDTTIANALRFQVEDKRLTEIYTVKNALDCFIQNTKRRVRQRRFMRKSVSQDIINSLDGAWDWVKKCEDLHQLHNKLKELQAKYQNMKLPFF